MERLLDMMEIKVYALHAGITSIKEQGKQVEVLLSQQGTNDVNGEALFKATQPLGRAMKLGVKEGQMKVNLNKSANTLDNLKFLVKCIEESMTIQDED